MSKVFNSTEQKDSLDTIKKENLFANCNVKVHYPPRQSSEYSLGEKELKNTGDKIVGNGFSKGKLKFQCHHEERKNRMNVKRKNLIQKLKYIYKIDVEDFNEDVVNKIIKKVKLIEKEKKEKKRRCLERTTIMITQLLKEQKYKMQESKGPQCLPPKVLKRLGLNANVCLKNERLEERESKVMKVVWEKCAHKLQDKDNYNLIVSSEEEEEKEEEKEKEKEEQGEQEDRPLTCLELLKMQKQTIPTIFTSEPAPCIAIEKYLVCTPKRIVFENYKKGKVYLQELRITNMDAEIIHCRYLGILIHNKSQEKFPIGVAVRDNVKLRPGLSSSTKIRLCSPDDSNEMECSVVYETRRQKKRFEHSLFFVPVACIPARAIVKVTPERIIFPAFTWCAATGSDNANYLKKSLKIENAGGKGCFCRISEKSSKPILEEIVYEEQEQGEEEEESLGVFSLKLQSEFSERTVTGRESTLKRGESLGEDYYSSFETQETAKSLVNELIENVFATFRFSKKYCIEIPPFSVQHIEVRFIPKYKGFHHENKYIQFEGCYNLEEQSIELMGDIKQIPLKIEPPGIDLKTCVINSGVYAKAFQVFNCSKGPYAVRLKIPPPLKNHAHVHPPTTIIQPFSSCVFSVRFYPRITFYEDVPQYFDEDSGVLEFPIRIHPSNLGDCKLDHIKLYVQALITTFNLELSPPAINFGNVTTLETVRTKLQLTNHSLAIQEYGFLDLAEGIRVEPNMGFGKIFPKETITLYLLYSPIAYSFELGCGKEEVEFDIKVTSIAEYGGFREKLEAEETFEELDRRVEDNGYEFLNFIKEVSSDNPEEDQLHEESEESDICDEDFSIEGEELMLKVQFQENKIRNFLKTENEETPKKSYSKQTASQNIDRVKDNEKDQGKFFDIGEVDEDEKFIQLIRRNMNLVKCRAKVVAPHCQISETVVQLPATPFDSFSLFRFHLKAVKETAHTGCSCGVRSAVKSYVGKPKFIASFEFLYSCPHIKLEPGSGFLKAGDSLPVTVISRPEFVAGELRPEPRIRKDSDILREKLNRKESLISRSDSGIKLSIQKKNYEAIPKGNKKLEESAIVEATFSSVTQMKKSDLFIPDSSFQEIFEPSFIETKVRCIVKTMFCEDESEAMELHDLVLICPIVKRHFAYLGKAQEIDFGKVFIGSRVQVVLQVQNISFERISPSMTLLNPAGPFFCPASFFKVDIDPEHIWRQTVTFVPEECREFEQFFEIYFGPTNILLKVIGTVVEPQYNILPSFGCCLLETKIGLTEEIKIEIFNQSPVSLFLSLDIDFVKVGFELQIEDDVETEGLSEGKMKLDRKEESKDKKKSKNIESEKKKYRIWETVPESVMNNLEYFEDCFIEDVFTLFGVYENNNFIVPSNETNQIKIQFRPPAEGSDKKYAVKYNLMVERRILLKEFLILGRILK